MVLEVLQQKSLLEMKRRTSNQNLMLNRLFSVTYSERTDEVFEYFIISVDLGDVQRFIHWIISLVLLDEFLEVLRELNPV
jgi:hypothetical protein